MRVENGSMIRLRKATQDDARALYLTRYAAYLAEYGAYGSPDSPCAQKQRDFAETLRAGDTYCIEAGGELAGGLVMESGEDASLLREIYIHPDYQQKGIAQLALLHAELRYPSAKYRAKVISSERAPLALLRKMGYKPARRQESGSDRITYAILEKDASSRVTLELQPLKREDLANAIEWLNADEQRDAFLPLWLHGREKTLSMAEFSKDFLFGKHFHGASQLDFAVKAVEFGKVIGMVSLQKIDWEQGTADVDHLVLDPRWRGGKLGKRVLQQLCAIAREEYGLSTLRLTVLADNARAIACFLSGGFAEALRRHNVMRGGDDTPRVRILMLKNLQEGASHGA